MFFPGINPQTKLAIRHLLDHMISCGVLLGIVALIASSAIAEAPLPKDPKLAEWTLKVESVMDEVRDLRRLSATNFNVPGAERPTIDEIRESWEKIDSVLPEGDLLKSRTAWIATKLAEPIDVGVAAKIAESTNYPMWAVQLREAAGEPGQKERAQAKAIKQDAQLKEFKERYVGAIIEGQYRDYENPPETANEWIEFLTTGPDDPWLRQCDGGFEHFVRGLPQNARLHRAMLMYYTPCVSCGHSPIEGEIDTTEPLLRLTAEIEPENLAQVFASESPSHGGWSEFQQHRITGDSGVTGNSLQLMRDLLEKVPDAKKTRAELLEVVSERIAEQDAKKFLSPRWRGLHAYLSDGAPDPSMDVEAILTAKLLGSETERRWALAWIPNMLSERAPAPKFVGSDLGKAISTASERCESNEDRFLACVALGLVEPKLGIDAVIANATVKHGDVAQAAVFALMKQYRLSRQELYDEATAKFTGVPEEFEDRLPKLRKAFYPRARIYGNAQYLMNMFADLGDEELDKELASIVDKVDNDSVNIIGRIAVCAMLHPNIEWPKTLEALRSAGERDDLEKAEWAARLANDLQSR